MQGYIIFATHRYKYIYMQNQQNLSVSSFCIVRYMGKPIPAQCQYKFVCFIPFRNTRWKPFYMYKPIQHISLLLAKAMTVDAWGTKVSTYPSHIFNILIAGVTLAIILQNNPCIIGVSREGGGLRGLQPPPFQISKIKESYKTKQKIEADTTATAVAQSVRAFA